MQPHEMSAVALLAAFSRRELSPVEAMRDVLDARRAASSRISRATYLFAPERALGEARASEARWRKGEPMGPLDGVPATVKDNIATRGDPTPLGTAASDTDALRRRRASRGAAARRRARSSSPRRPCRTTACCRPGSRASTRSRAIRGISSRNPGGSSAGAGAAGAAQYGPLHIGHRHRRLDPPAGRLVRPRRPQAQRGPRADRPALYRPRRRADDARRRRRGADDGDALRARRAGLCEPATTSGWIGPSSRRTFAACGSGFSWMPAAAFRRRPRCRAAVERAARDFETAGAHRRAARAVPLAGHARRARPVLAARAARSSSRPCPRSGAPGLPFIQEWASGARAFRRGRFLRLQPDPGDARGRPSGRRCLSIIVLSPTAPMTAFPAEWAIAEQRSGEPVLAYRLHRRLQHVRAAGGVDQLRLRRRRPADRPADRRPAVRRPRRALHGAAPSRRSARPRCGRGRSRRAPEACRAGCETTQIDVVLRSIRDAFPPFCDDRYTIWSKNRPEIAPYPSANLDFSRTCAGFSFRAPPQDPSASAPCPPAALAPGRPMTVPILIFQNNRNF